MREEKYSFEKLEAWKKAKDLALFIYEITSKFPDTEKYGLINQMRKCAIGIPSHLAEGSGRITGKDKAHFTSMAYSTLMELLNQTIISHDLGYIILSDYETAKKKIKELSPFFLSKLRQSQLNA